MGSKCILGSRAPQRMITLAKWPSILLAGSRQGREELPSAERAGWEGALVPGLKKDGGEAQFVPASIPGTAQWELQCPGVSSRTCSLSQRGGDEGCAVLG